MAGEWRQTTVGDFAPFSYGKALPEEARRVGGTVPVFGSNGVVGFHDMALTDGPTVIVGRKGTVGAVHFSPKPCWPIDTTFFVSGRDQQLTRFKYYALKSLGLEHMNADSAVPGLNRDAAHARMIPVPEESEQRAIAHILGTPDDRIDLNRRMNETLEAMARALFKSWFVDVAQAHLPRGWTQSEIHEIAEVIDCLHSKKPERQPTGKPLLQLWNIRDDALIDMADTYYITEQDYQLWTSRMEASPGDCVITNVGRVAATAQIPEGLRAALGRNMTGVRCRPIFPYPTFLIECLQSSAMKEEIALKTDVGTILDALNVRNIPRLRFVRPTSEAASRFETVSRPLRARMERNVAESRTIAALRDTLLPNLISGKLRVKDAMRFIGETP